MILYLYILYVSPNVFTAVLHIICDVDSMNRSWHQFYTVYSAQYGELTHVQAVKTGNARRA